MATTKEYKNYILGQLELLDNVLCKPMMGGYLFYHDGKLFGGLYGGDRMLIKIVESNKKYKLKEEIPYLGSKQVMYLIEDTENKEKLRDIIIDTCKDLASKR